MGNGLRIARDAARGTRLTPAQRALLETVDAHAGRVSDANANTIATCVRHGWLTSNRNNEDLGKWSESPLWITRAGKAMLLRNT